MNDFLKINFKNTWDKFYGSELVTQVLFCFMAIAEYMIL